MGTGGAVIARGQQLVGCEETIIHYQSRPVWVRGRVEDEGGRKRRKERINREKGGCGGGRG